MLTTSPQTQNRSAQAARAGGLSRIGPLAVLVGGVALRLPRLGIPFTDNHDFRQTQTAITVQAFLDQGVSVLRYPTPVFGPPWTLPFEFPTFQLSAYPLARLGMPLELACRTAALAWYALSAVLLLRLALRWTEPRIALASLAFYLFSPFGLLWSRASLIDYASVALALGYVLLLGRWVDSPRTGRLTWTIAVGALAFLTKITTLAVVAPAVAVLLAGACSSWLARGQRRRALGHVAGAALAVALPLLAGLAWTAWADHVKSGSPSTAWLTSEHLTRWNFGSWEQRLDAGAWRGIGERIARTILPGALLLLGLPAVWRAWRRRGTATSWAILAAILGAGLAVGTFFNLYAVHDYYLIAVTPPLALLAGAGLVTLAEIPVPWVGVGARALLLAVLVVLATGRVWRWYALPYALSGYRDRTGEPLLEVARQIAALTPRDGWVVVEGEDWNPRLLYWAHRRGFYVKPGITDPAQVAARPEVATLVCRECPESLLSLWPARRTQGTVGGFQLFSVR